MRADDDASSEAGELRAEYRHRVDQPPLGHITLQSRSSSQPVRLIRDISAHGVSLLVDEAVAPGEPVLIAQVLGDSASLHTDRTSAQTHAPHAPPVGAEALGASREHVYRAYVVWCRRQAADELCPVPGYVAGLRVFDPHGLGQLVEPALT
jgi:hypothetical protein